MASALPDDLGVLDRALGTHRPVSGLPARRASGRLHTPHDRGAQPPDPQDHQDPRALPRRGRRAQAAVSRDHKRPTDLEANLQLDPRAALLRDPLRRPAPRERNLIFAPSHQLGVTVTLTHSAYTESRTPSVDW